MLKTNKRKIVNLEPGQTPEEGGYGVCFIEDDYYPSSIRTVQGGEYFVTQKTFASIELAQEWLDNHYLSDFYSYGSISLI